MQGSRILRRAMMNRWMMVLSFVICHCSFIDAQTLLTVNGEPVSSSEFAYSYHHNTDGTEAEGLSPSDYLDRFIDYRLKLAAAFDAGYELPSQVGRQTVAANPTVNVADREACYQLACQEAGGHDMLYPAQIVLRVDTRSSSAELAKVKQRIDSVYQALSQGADFAELARRLSDDATASSGGLMGWVGPSQLLETVEQEAYALQRGEMSRPFLSLMGWHIIKMIDRQPVTSETVHQWFLAPGKEQVLSLDVPAENEQLTREYYEGLLVSRITQETVYDQPAPEEKQLQRYFKKNKKRYGKKVKKRDYPSFRDLVLVDYMQLREQEWVEDLRHQYKVRVDKRILKTIE